MNNTAMGQEHFEDNLKHALSGLRFEPGHSTFVRIQARLVKRKRRKIFILFFAGLGLLSLLYFSLAPFAENIFMNAPLAKTGQNNTIQKAETKLPAATNNVEEEASPANSIVITPPAVNNSAIPTELFDGGASVQTTGIVAGEAAIRAFMLSRKKAELPLLTKDASILNVDGLILIAETHRSQGEIVKKNRSRFYFGLNFTPQAGAMQLNANPGRHETFNTEGGQYASQYLSHRKSENDIRYCYSIGIKAGMVSGERWEITTGIGFQKISYSESEQKLSSGGGVTPTNPTYFNSEEDQGPSMNQLRYLSSNTEICRIIGTEERQSKFKAGMGMLVYYRLPSPAQTLAAPNTYVTNGSGLDQWGLMPAIKFGWIEQLTEGIHLQVCPTLSYSFNSLFRKDYVIRQRYLGAGMEFGIYLRPVKK